LAPRYYVGLERRAYLLKPDDIVFIGRPDIAFIPHQPPEKLSSLPLADVAVLNVDVPMSDEVGENYLEIHEVETGELVTVLELLSPANKLHNQGREEYERKRDQIFRSRTNLEEIDLLRAGEPMMVVRPNSRKRLSHSGQPGSRTAAPNYLLSTSANLFLPSTFLCYPAMKNLFWI
jgi:hypothetical protein